MASTITAGNATNGLGISSDNTGILQLKTGTGAGTTALTIDASQNATFAGNVVGAIKSGTAVASTSGTAIDFTGIPATAKRITVMFSGVSTSGTSGILVQSGAGSAETTGYSSINSIFQNAASPTVTPVGTGFSFTQGQAAADTLFGMLIMSLLGSNTWSYTSNIYRAGGTNQQQNGTGAKTFSGVIDRVRITTVNGTDTFDAGSINILWE